MSGERQGEWHEWPFEPLPILRTLDRRGVEYVLVGGLAAVLQGSPLPTYDVDIAPAPSAANRERLAGALADIEAAALGDAGDVEEAVGQDSDTSFLTPFGYVDVHWRPAGFATYTALRRNAVPTGLEPGHTVLVSPLRDIIRSRLAAGDLRQLPALEATLELSDAVAATR